MEDTRAEGRRVLARPAVWLFALVVFGVLGLWSLGPGQAPGAEPAGGLSLDLTHRLDCDGSARLSLTLTNGAADQVDLTWVRLTGLPPGSVSAAAAGWDAAGGKWVVTDLPAASSATIDLRVAPEALPARISATIEDITGSGATVGVDAAVTPTLTLTSSADTIEVGETVTVSGAVVGLADGCSLAGDITVSGAALAIEAGQDLTWVASGAGPFGPFRLRGVTPGQSTVTVAAGGLSARVGVAVNEPIEVGLAWTEPTLDTCSPTASATLVATATTASGSPVDPARFDGITVALDHPPGSATLGPDGRVVVSFDATAGTAVVTATNDDWAPASIELRVGPQPVSVAFDDDTLTFGSGRQARVGVNVGPLRCGTTIEFGSDSLPDIDPSRRRLLPRERDRQLTVTAPSCPAGAHTITATAVDTETGAVVGSASAEVTCEVTPRLVLDIAPTDCAGPDARTFTVAATNVGTGQLRAGTSVQIRAGNGLPETFSFVLPRLGVGATQTSPRFTVAAVDPDEALTLTAAAPDAARGDRGDTVSLSGALALRTELMPRTAVAGGTLEGSIRAVDTPLCGRYELEVSVNAVPIDGVALVPDGVTADPVGPVDAASDRRPLVLRAEAPGLYVVDTRAVRADGTTVGLSSIVVSVLPDGTVAFDDPVIPDCASAPATVRLHATSMPAGLDVVVSVAPPSIALRADGLVDGIWSRDDQTTLDISVELGDEPATITAELAHPLFAVDTPEVTVELARAELTDLAVQVRAQVDGTTATVSGAANRAPCTAEATLRATVEGSTQVVERTSAIGGDHGYTFVLEELAAGTWTAEVTIDGVTVSETFVVSTDDDSGTDDTGDDDTGDDDSGDDDTGDDGTTDGATDEGTPPPQPSVELLALFVNGAAFAEYLDPLQQLGCGERATFVDGDGPAQDDYVLVLCYLGDREERPLLGLELTLGTALAERVDLDGLSGRLGLGDADTTCRREARTIRCDRFRLPADGLTLQFSGFDGSGRALVSGRVCDETCEPDAAGDRADGCCVEVATDSELIRSLTADEAERFQRFTGGPERSNDLWWAVATLLLTAAVLAVLVLLGRDQQPRGTDGR